MTQRQSSRMLSYSLIGVSLISVATGILGAIIYNNHNHIIVNKGAFLSLVVSQFICAAPIPFTFHSSLLFLQISIVLIGISGLASLGSGISSFYLLILQSNELSNLYNSNTFKSFTILFFASLFLTGITFGQHIQHLIWIPSQYYESSYEESSDVEQNEEKSKIPQNVKGKLLSLKASAATLVDSTISKPSENNQRVISQNTSIITDKSSHHSYNNTTSDYRQVSPLDKLPIINQSSSSINLYGKIDSSETKHLSAHLITPMLSKTRNVSTNRNLILERNALKRIPSALLPPHLRPQDKTSQSLATSPDFIGENVIASSQSEMFLQPRDEPVMEAIPRAMSVDDILPYSFASPHANGLRTISLVDWEKHHEQYQYEQYRKPSTLLSGLQSPLPLPETQVSSDEFQFSLEPDEIVSDHDDIESIIEENEIVNNSTEEAMRYIEEAHDGLCDEDVIESAMNVSQSNIVLEEAVEITSRTRSHSPHKSIFRHQSQKSSVSSFNFRHKHSSSVPSSPKKRTLRGSPKKLKIKNLSLSSIVYKDTDDDIPNFSYVHELQRSPSKSQRRQSDQLQCTTPIQNKTFDQVLKDKTNTTPESNWSENSHKSVFPSEVIGEYDKEKWKTMQRLNLVEHNV